MYRILCILLLLFAGYVYSPAQDDYYIKDYFVDLRLEKNGKIKITELLRIHFNVPRHGIYRDLPLEYNVPSNVWGSFLDQLFFHKLFIDDIEVRNHPFKKQSFGTGVRLKIGDKDKFVHGEQLYQISYTIENGLLHGDNQTELYWNLIGDYISEEVQHAGFKITLPEGIQIQAGDINVWTGKYGAREQDVNYELKNGIITGETTESLGRNKAMTVSIRMPSNAVAKFPAYRLWFYHLKFLFIPVLLILGFWYIWWNHGRDTRLADMVGYLPPKNMDPALAGFAIDIKANKRDALALIPYFGANGFLKVDHKKNKGIFSEDEITLYKLKDLPSNAPAHQKVFFNALFKNRDIVALSSLKEKFHSNLLQTLDSIGDTVLSSDYFIPKTVSIYRNSIWIVIVLGIINAVFCFFAGRFVFLALSLMIAAILAWFSYLHLKRSQTGDEKLKEINGFRKFIRLAEKDKLNFLVKEDPSYFDKTLPYAIAFDCADEWSEKFKGLTLPAPQWYTSNVPYYNSMSGFNAADFNKAMSTSLDEMRTVMSSVPSSSGSSGSSGGGGGFSGGGFGGGGVSSW
jgi:uncharacterized membrane protein YgcG